MFFKRSEPRRKPSGPEGHRVYVIGDVHGMDALLDDLLAKIEDDVASEPVARATIVFVGDLIDRGPGSSRVIERLRTYSHPSLDTVFLLGNHEEVLLRIINGDTALIGKWLQFGGAECLSSYGADPDAIASASEQDALRLVRDAIPGEHVRFLADFVDSCAIGDYLVVHAGIRPGIEIDRQRQSDLRWIRDPFLSDDRDHGAVVVHGHTIVATVEERENRIAIDTGAYRSGILSALVIDGANRRLLAAGDRVGARRSEPRRGPPH